MAIHLPKDSFLALAAVAWSDGVFTPEEGEALLRAGRAAGLDAADLADVQRYTTTSITIPEVDTIRMSRGDRVLTYALATWLARLDGVVTPEERDTLALLGERLGIPDGVRSRASAAAFEVASLPEGDRPDRYDFDALKQRLATKLGDDLVED
jgi:hypothetical protein